MKRLVLFVVLAFVASTVNAQYGPQSTKSKSAPRSRSTQSQHQTFYGRSELDAQLRAERWMNRNGGNWRATQSQRYGNSGRGYQFKFERKR